MNQFYHFTLFLLILFTLSVYGNIPIGNNCDLYRNNEPGAALGLKPVTDPLRKDRRSQMTLTYVLDSDRTLASTTPEQRQKLSEHCQERALWRVTQNGEKQLCYIFLRQLQPTHHNEPFDADGMSVVGIDPPLELLRISTRTVNAIDCFNDIKSITIPLRPLAVEIVDSAIAERVPVENKIFSGLEEGKTIESPPVILVIERTTGEESSPSRNLNFRPKLVFVSPYDSKHRLHYINVVGLLDKPFLSELLGTKDMSLQNLLENFGIQVIILTEGVDDDLLNKLTAIGTTLGAALLATNQAWTKKYAARWGHVKSLTYKPVQQAIDAYYASGKPRYPSALRSQILAIGPHPSRMKAILNISPSVAKQLAS